MENPSVGRKIVEKGQLAERARTAATAAREYHKPIIADGGIKYSGDVVKALAAPYRHQHSRIN